MVQISKFATAIGPNYDGVIDLGACHTGGSSSRYFEPHIHTRAGSYTTARLMHHMVPPPIAPIAITHANNLIVLRAGRLTRPEGKLTLTMSGNQEVRDGVLRYLRTAHAA